MAANEAVQATRAIDWLAPLDAYRMLRAAGRQPMLLDGLGAHPEARRAYLAFDADLEVRLAGRTMQTRRLGHLATRRVEDPLAALRAVLEAHRLPGRRAGFTGGFVGYVGYEAARLFEPTLPPPAPAGTPDVVLHRCTSVVAFDRRDRRIQVHATDLDGDPQAAERRAAEAADLLATLHVPSPRPPAPAHVPRWTTSLDEAGFRDAVERLRARIGEGDLFQANLATRFTTPLRADPTDLFAALQAANPSPYMALLEFHDHAVVSGSPEQLFALEDGVLSSRPIAGTRPRGASAEEDAAMEHELLTDAKEDAEHTMLVDLLRNDIARVAEPGTVAVPERKSVERYRHVMHLVSRVAGRIRDGLGPLDALAALFPGGTVTGAPKHRACLRIAEAEPVPRGPYTGSAGWISFDGQAAFNILIRTLVLRGGQATVHAGSGIVADSVPEREWREANHKAQALLEAATGHDPGTGNRTRLGEVTRNGDWHPARPDATVRGRRVLIIDNYDSFVHNLADYCAALGAMTRVVRNDADVDAVAASFRPTHIVLSPGPGHPKDSMSTLRYALAAEGVPVLGVCLGHQAIGLAHGGRIVAGLPVHGKTSEVLHDGTGLLSGVPSPLVAARYHSLAVTDLPPELEATARLGDGTVMALRHRSRPVWGVQFHPESVGTTHGLRILRNFLEVSL